MDRTCRSKIDWWLAAIIRVAALMEVGVSVVFVVAPSISRVFGSLMASLCLASAIFMVWTFFSTHYVIGETDLLARSGPVRMRIPLAAIVAVHPTRNPLSAPASSLDRLRINYDKNGPRRFLLISPEDKEGFLHNLAAAVPALNPDSDRPPKSFLEI